VLPIGGLREKVLAAHRAGLKTVILPERNLKDLVDVPKKVLTDLTIVPVTHMDQVLKVSLHPISESPQHSRKASSKAAEQEQLETEPSDSSSHS
jgi:ATP-dependent Lon protease